jgi:uncharacterized protein YjiS (DUF1127 family)
MAQASTDPQHALGVLDQPVLPVLAVVAVKFAVCLTLWTTRRHTRAALRQLEPWQLADVGLTPAEASREASRVFWRP